MAEGGPRNINIIAIKRVDPFAKEIIDSSAHVALYTFEENEWEKTSIEGALFVYSRHGTPLHSLVILNRLNRINLIEPISKGVEFQLKEPFLLFRNTKLRIYGIWFYEVEECVRLSKQLSSLVNEPTNQISSENMSTFNATPSTSAPINIFKMLTKAQDDFKANQYNPNAVASTSECTPPRAPDMTSKSVMDFFAKAGSGGSIPIPNASSLPSPGIFPQQAGNSNQPLLLQRLMSNPAHSVEHIEKQQRSVTPQDTPVANGGLDTFMQKKSTIEKELKNLQKTEMKAQTAKEINASDTLEKDISFMNISTPKPVSPLATFLNQTQENNTPTTFNGSKVEERGSFSLSNLLTPQQKPALMPPTMFTSSSNKEETQLEPLTKNQMLQAINYLLKNDAEFVNKLHDAYVKSFTDKLHPIS